MNKTLGQRIKSLRQKENKSQGKIAAVLGISIPAYCKIETGITDVNITRLKQLASLFNVTTDSLLSDDPYDEKLKKITTEKDSRISELQNQVAELQKKLINAYEENHSLHKQFQELRNK